MAEVGLEVCARFLPAPGRGGAGARPLLGGPGLGLGLGACVEVALGSSSVGLSAHGWGWVPALWVVWPEAPRRWSLQAIGWDQVSGTKDPKCLPAAFMTPERAADARRLPRRPSKTRR